jgi:hypothetical protein
MRIQATNAQNNQNHPIIMTREKSEVTVIALQKMTAVFQHPTLSDTETGQLASAPNEPPFSP